LEIDDDGLTSGIIFTNTTRHLILDTSTTAHSRCELQGSSHLSDQGCPLQNCECHENLCGSYGYMYTIFCSYVQMCGTILHKEKKTQDWSYEVLYYMRTHLWAKHTSTW
jgi:hypothetical protein